MSYRNLPFWQLGTRNQITGATPDHQNAEQRMETAAQRMGIPSGDF